MTIIASNSLTLSNVNDGTGIANVTNFYLTSNKSTGIEKPADVVNLIRNGGYPTNTNYWSGAMTVSRHVFYYNGQKNLFLLQTTGTSEIVAASKRFEVKRNTNYSLSFYAIAAVSVKISDVYFIGRKSNETNDFTSVNLIIGNHRFSASKAEYVTITFNSGDNDNGYIRFDNNGSRDGTNAMLYFGEVMLVEGREPKPWVAAIEDSGWTRIPQQTTYTNRFLWNYRIELYTDGITKTIEPAVIGVYGEKGDPGHDGRAGKDGTGIKTTVISYAISTSGTTAPNTSWTSQVPSLVKGQYLWTKTVWTYTDNSSETGYSVTYISKDGNNGHDGIAGKDGTGIKTTTITYASHTNGTTAPTTGYTTTVPSVPAGQFLWTKTIWTYTDNSFEIGYSVAMMGLKGDKGDPGIKGSDGTSGIIVSSVAPASPQNGQLWQDTSTTPQLVKKWTGASWVIWELYVENMNVNNLSALSPNLGNITGGSYTSWKYIGTYNAQGDTAMAGIYINEGVIRSLVVINSNTQDPNKPNAIEFARLEGSQTAFGSTNYYIDNTPIYKQFTLNEVLKGSQFWNTTKRANINTLAGSIVVGKDADSASSIFISAKNAYISRWSTDYSFVDVDMLETISSHKVLFDGGFDNRYDATNNRDTNTLSLGNLVGVKYLQIYVCVYQRLHIINLDISNTFSAFDGIWSYSTLYNAPERATLSPGTWRDWNMELLCNGAIADSQLRWGGMFFKETGDMGYRAADTSNMKNTFIYKIVGVY